MLWVTEQWTKLPREVVEPPFLEALKSCLHIALGNVPYMALLWQSGWTRTPPGPFQPQLVCDNTSQGIKHLNI